MPVKTTAMTRGRDNRFLLVYSSQTGQAQAISEEIAEKATSHGLQADMRCISLTEKKFWLERETCLVLVTSTTGDGEPPDTALKFWRRLKKKTLPSDHFKHLSYALLALGDSNYTSFCCCGKMFDKRLEELGASHFYDTGFADDATGLEVVVEPWMEGLFPALRRQLGLPEVETPSSSDDLATIEEQQTPSTAAESQEGSINLGTFGVQSNPTGSESGRTMKEAVDLIKTGSQVEQNAIHSETSTTNGAKCSMDGVDAGHHNSLVPSEQEVESLSHSLSPLRESSLTLPALPPRFIDLNFNPDTKLDLTSLPIQNNYKFPSAGSDVHSGRLVAAQVMTRDDALKKALKVTVDISTTGWKYQPGDAFGVICQNSAAEVQDLIDRLGLTDQADIPCSLSVLEVTKKRNAAVPAYLPPEGTARHWLTHCCDIRTAPQKALVRALVECTSDARQKRRIQELCSKQGADSYNRYVREAGVGLLDILKAFPACRPEFTLLLEHLPRLNARPYSAASSQAARPDQVDFVFNVVEIPAGSGRQTDRHGVCTGWFDSLTKKTQRPAGGDSLDQVIKQMKDVDLVMENIMIPMFLRSHQHFRPPNDLEVPLIMVGPGTGIAPFIGFLQQREYQMRHQAVDLKSPGDAWLYYGCRHEERDFLFREELENFKEHSILKELKVCFSRDSPDGSTPRYVQDNIRHHGDELCSLLGDKLAHVYVCGDARNMAKDVRNAFVEILEKCKDITTKEAESFLNDMIVNGRYHEDVW